MFVEVGSLLPSYDFGGLYLVWYDLPDCLWIQRPPILSIKASSGTLSSKTVFTSSAVAASMSSKALAWATVRGKPSKMKPLEQSAALTRSLMIPITILSLTSCPASMTAFAFLPISVPESTVSLNMSPVDNCGMFLGIGGKSSQIQEQRNGVKRSHLQYNIFQYINCNAISIVESKSQRNAQTSKKQNKTSKTSCASWIWHHLTISDLLFSKHEVASLNPKTENIGKHRKTVGNSMLQSGRTLEMRPPCVPLPDAGGPNIKITWRRTRPRKDTNIRTTQTRSNKSSKFRVRGGH